MSGQFWGFEEGQFSDAEDDDFVFETNQVQTGRGRNGRTKATTSQKTIRKTSLAIPKINMSRSRQIKFNLDVGRNVRTKAIMSQKRRRTKRRRTRTILLSNSKAGKNTILKNSA